LDIGANHPIKINNTYLFYKQGSRGVCVEPNPKLCKIIKNKRKKDTVLNIGIGKEEKTNIDFFVMNSDVLSTFSKEEANYLIKNAKQTPKKVIKIIQKNN
jgi:serine/threonine protein phosphatase PrpC